VAYQLADRGGARVRVALKVKLSAADAHCSLYRRRIRSLPRSLPASKQTTPRHSRTYLAARPRTARTEHGARSYSYLHKQYTHNTQEDEEVAASRAAEPSRAPAVPVSGYGSGAAPALPATSQISKRPPCPCAFFAHLATCSRKARSSGRRERPGLLSPTCPLPGGQRAGRSPRSY